MSEAPPRNTPLVEGLHEELTTAKSNDPALAPTPHVAPHAPIMFPLPARIAPLPVLLLLFLLLVLLLLLPQGSVTG